MAMNTNKQIDKQGTNTQINNTAANDNLANILTATNFFCLAQTITTITIKTTL